MVGSLGLTAMWGQLAREPHTLATAVETAVRLGSANTVRLVHPTQAGPAVALAVMQGTAETAETTTVEPGPPDQVAAVAAVAAPFIIREKEPAEPEAAVLVFMVKVTTGLAEALIILELMAAAADPVGATALIA